MSKEEIKDLKFFILLVFFFMSVNALTVFYCIDKNINESKKEIITACKPVEAKRIIIPVDKGDTPVIIKEKK